ncbi:MAG: glycosyltransferase [Brevundimonas sp.]
MITVGIIGTRGIPNGHGGFERFVELLVDDARWGDTEVRFKVFGEAADREYNPWTDLRDVGFTKNERPFWYYFRSAMLATEECDIVLCCGVALSIFSFWPPLHGKALVINPDGCEWRRTKWSLPGRLAVRMMYLPALLAARRVVIDAEALREDFNLGPKAWYIPYSAPEPTVSPMPDEARDALDLHRPYMLVVARLEPENNVQAIVQAFAALDQTEVDLIVVGGKTTPFYESGLKGWERDNIRFVGPIYDQDRLNQLRSNCIAYMHGHSVGGTNPSLLEALATVTGELICHDNKYNREVAGNNASYFRDVPHLSQLMNSVLSSDARASWNGRAPVRDVRFHPDTIFNRYLEFFRSTHAAR